MLKEFGEKCLSQVYKSIVRIELHWEKNGELIGSQGSGFIIAKYFSNNRIVIATAKHVLSFPEDVDVKWKISQFDLFGKEERKLEFTSNKNLLASSFCRFHTIVDIALVFLPSIQNAFFNLLTDMPLNTISSKMGIMNGARIGWAGFPSILEEFLGMPKLSYYEGVISCNFDQNGKLFYIVDGHGSSGSSGCPVWAWDFEKDTYFVIGLMNGYVSDAKIIERNINDENSDSLIIKNIPPGYCIFESINPMIAYIESENKAINTFVINTI